MIEAKEFCRDMIVSRRNSKPSCGKIYERMEKDLIEKLLFLIKKGLRILSCITICFLTIIVAMQVVNRNFFDRSFTWVEELSSILMIYIAYFGAAIATINDSNTRIDFFIRKLPDKGYRIISCLDDFICIAFLIIVICYSAQGMSKNLNMFTPALHLPVSVNYLGVLLGCILMVLFYSVHAVLDLKKFVGQDVSREEAAITKDE